MQTLGKSDPAQANSPVESVDLPTQLPTGLRNQKKRRTRQAIRAAAIELFTTQGVEATTVEQIAAAADISPRTFFNYFDTKEAAVSLPYGLRNEAAPQQVGPSTGSTWLIVSTACSTLAQALERDTDERDTLLAGVRLCQREPSLLDQASAQRGRWERLLLVSHDTSLNSRVIVNSAAGAFWAALVDWAESDGNGSLVTLVQESLKMIEPQEG